MNIKPRLTYKNGWWHAETKPGSIHVNTAYQGYGRTIGEAIQSLLVCVGQGFIWSVTSEH